MARQLYEKAVIELPIGLLFIGLFLIIFTISLKLKKGDTKIYISID